jgi:hypothetical protein
VANATDAVRRACGDDDPAVREAAYAALAVVGDGGDVPALVESLRAGGQGDARATYDALTGISGVHFAYREVLWRNWWRETKANFPTRLKAALDTVETGGAPGDVADARGVIRRTAWIDLKLVSARVERWLVSGRPELRADGYRLCAELRLGDLADDVRIAQRCEYDPALQPAAAACAKRLGVAMESAAPAGRGVVTAGAKSGG